MYAIEFKTKIKNGTIEVPQKYKNKLKANVKVIVIAEEDGTAANIIDKLLDSPLKVKNFTPLTREEIYAHR